MWQFIHYFFGYPLALDAVVRSLPPYHAEMTLILLGTGDPISSVHRAKSANLILAGGKTFLVDCGTDTVKQMLRARVPIERIDGIFFTHHHSDHNLGFMDLLVSASHRRQESLHRDGALPIYGPTNTKDIISKMIEALSWDIHIRLQNGGKKLSSFDVVYHENNEGVVYDHDGLRITAFVVDHGHVKPAIGYCFEYRGKKIVISGDTRFSPTVLEQARNADVLLHEAYSRHWIGKIKKIHPEFSQIIEEILASHSSTLEVANLAAAAHVKHLVFTHLMPTPAPWWFFERSWLKGVRAIFRGRITVGRDLMMF